MPQLSDLTVTVLLYGDHFDLAQRCLTPLRFCQSLGIPLRIGLNAVCAQTHEWVTSQFPAAKLFVSDHNLYKYPAMRAMFHTDPILTPYVMWFDDDSCLAPEISHSAASVCEWFIGKVSQISQADFVGQLMRMRPQGRQLEWIEQQPWFTGRVFPDEYMPFLAGGWWVAKLSVLRQFDYPWPALQHNGGDFMLGALIYQQSLSFRNIRTGVWINANKYGKEHRARRRGLQDGLPIGYKF